MRRLVFSLFVTAVTVCFSLYAGQFTRAQSTQLPNESQRAAAQTMVITGKIVKEAGTYYIQGQRPSSIFTILNPVPKKLDGIVKNGKSIEVEVGIVLGDNVEIQKINGKAYQIKSK